MRICLIAGWLAIVVLVSSLCCVFMKDASAQDTDDLRMQVKQMGKQMEQMETIIKSQQEMLEVLKSNIESKEPTVQPSVSVIEESEIEQVIDNYLMKGETGKEMVKVGSVSQLAAYWDKGLRFKSEDGNFKLSVGGRINNDWGWFGEENNIKNAIGDQVDSTQQRRARLYMAGTIYENIGYKIEFDWAGGSASFNDVFMELKKVPVLGNFRVGHTKEPYSLETMNSSKYMTFLERGLNNTFAPFRNTGFRAYNHALDKRLSWSAGIFRNANAFGDSVGNRSTEGGYSLSGRITGLPLYEDDGVKLIHTGISYSHQNAFADDEQETGFQFRSKPETNLASYFVDTGRFTADSANLYNPELAVVYGPFSFQVEYTFADINLKRDTQPDPRFTAFYAYGSYFLTGEHRVYKREKGAFSRITPKNNFKWGRGQGKGAIELAARYSELDLSDKSIDGGRMQDTTLGVNWYL
ncbi:MAG: porin, partial [Candidatus Scalindua sp.]|nr:porin [Candidatus Scalindua sp.]MCR4345334.1 porin [Candidatus Scalindua sp.]